MRNETGEISGELKQRGGDWRLLDEFHYMPESLWPMEAVVIDDRPCHLWHRSTPWTTVGERNESNYELYGRLWKSYSECHPDECEGSDGFWTENASRVIRDSLARRDYVMEEDFENHRLKGNLKDFDVVLQTTLGGFLTHPFIVYGIEYQDIYYAHITYDEYANGKFREFREMWDERKKSEDEEALMHEWQTTGFKESKMLDVKMIKEGHATYTVNEPCRDWRMKIRWTERADGRTVLHKSQY